MPTIKKCLINKFNETQKVSDLIEILQDFKEYELDIENLYTDCYIDYVEVSYSSQSIIISLKDKI